jgi:AAA family ATP:ADP antiporter
MRSSVPLRALRAIVDVEEREVAALLLAFAYFFCLLGSYYIIRPVRETMGTLGGVRELSWMFTGTFVAMLVMVPLFAAVVARMPRRRFVPLAYRFFIANIAVFVALLAGGANLTRVAQAFFIWTSVFNLFVVSVFWSVMADLFVSEQGKRLFGFIAAGGTLGQLVVSWLTSALARDLGLPLLLLASAILLEGAVQCARALFRMTAKLTASAGAVEPGGQDRDAEPPLIGGNPLQGVTRVARSPYLLGICLYILCLTVTATVVYFQQAEIVRSAFTDPEDKTVVFARINLAVGLLTVLVQALVTGRILRWLGLSTALAILPVLVALGLASLALAPILVVLVVFESLRRACNYAVARPSREVLFTVVSREDKYKAKNFIDTVVYRGGDMMAGWAYSGLVVLGLGLSAIALSALPLTLLWLATGLLLGRKHEAIKRDLDPHPRRNQ